MSQTFVFRFSLAAMLSTASLAYAQSDQDSLHLRVDIIPAAPPVEGVVLRGDTALFLTRARDSAAYGYDRRRGNFFRTKALRNFDRYRSGNAVGATDFVIADSIQLTEVRINDDLQSRVLKDPRGRTIPLRGPRVDAEKKWRRAHGLSETPVISDEIDDPRLPHPTDWASIETLSYAVDRDAIWIGLRNGSGEYLDFALGGLLRIDRASRRVTVAEDSALMHRSVAEIEPWSGGYVLIADRSVMLFDPATGRVSDLKLPGTATEVAVANDTAFVASEDGISLFDLRKRKLIASRGFRLDVTDDAIGYALADKTTQPSWDTLAILGVADRLGIKRVRSFLNAARGIVKASALEYYYPGDRISGLEPVENADSAQNEDYPREGPTAVIAEGLDDPRLRPFLHDALLEIQPYAHVDIARILLSEADSGAAPFLRVALKNMKGAYAAQLAASLSLLGDTAGNAWIHRALLDTLHASGDLDTAEKIHWFTFEAAGRVRDSRNVERLLELAAHPRYGWSATSSLIAYRSPEIALRLLPRVIKNDSMMVLARFLDGVVGDSTFPMTPALRDSARSAATRLLYGSDIRWRSNGARAIGAIGDARDLPALIGALTLDQFTYAGTVVVLVSLAGTGASAMPEGQTDPAHWAAAQRWWTEWYRVNARTFRRASREQSDHEIMEMLKKLNR